MNYQEDRGFLDLINQLKELNIDINPEGISELYDNLRLYIRKNNDDSLDLKVPELYDKSYFLYLALRELGNKIHKTNDPLSKDISTIVYENYFFESKENTISKIIDEIYRITKGNFECKVVSESIYDEKNNPDVVVELDVIGNLYRFTHEDKFEDGTLLSSFIEDVLFSNLKGVITKGHLFYDGEESCLELVYVENEKDYLNFKDLFNYQEL